MKRMLFALLAILMLTACGKEEAPVPPPAETPQVSEVPVIQEAAPEQPEDEQIEIPAEIIEPEEPSPEEVPAEEFPMEWEIVHVEGLLEDTVAYDLEQIVFSNVDCADQISEYYEELVVQLENHTKENVYPAVMEQHTGANVYGVMDAISWNDQWVEVEYSYRVEYLNGAKEEKFSRIDRFDLQTGEIIYAE